MPVDSFTHNPWLVVAALAVALISGFTGLTLTRDLSKRPFNQRILIVSMAAVAMGGGIWSMHFVAMLGLQLPFLYYYDAAITLASALVAILVVGLALLILHFTPRRPPVLIGAGVLVGAGVLAMHYIGMAALELCRAVHAPWGIVLAAVSACGAATAASSARSGSIVISLVVGWWLQPPMGRRGRDVSIFGCTGPWRPARAGRR